MAQTLQLPVGLEDSELQTYRRSGADLVVDVRSWNEKRLTFDFHNVIAVREVLAGNFSDLVEGNAAAQALLKEALARNFESVPTSHPYRVYSFLDVEGAPSLEVVAA